MWMSGGKRSGSSSVPTRTNREIAPDWEIVAPDGHLALWTPGNLLALTTRGWRLNDLWLRSRVHNTISLVDSIESVNGAGFALAPMEYSHSLWVAFALIGYIASPAVLTTQSEVVSVAGLGCHAEGQRGEVGLIGCRAVKARMWASAIVEVEIASQSNCVLRRRRRRPADTPPRT